MLIFGYTMTHCNKWSNLDLGLCTRQREEAEGLIVCVGKQSSSCKANFKISQKNAIGYVHGKEKWTHNCTRQKDLYLHYTGSQYSISHIIHKHSITANHKFTTQTAYTLTGAEK